MQLVHADVELPLTFEDLCGLSGAERIAAVAARRAHEASTPFVRSQPPLIRFHVQQLTNDTSQLFITEHHAILDGWSERSLFAELLLRYGDALAGRDERPKDRLASRFQSYVGLERAAIEAEDAAQHWASLLDGMSLISLPRLQGREGDVPRPSGMAFHGAPLLSGMHRKLARLAGELGVSLRSVLLAAHLRVMGILGATDDVVTGAVYNGRGEERDAENCLGLFLNTLPLRARLPGGTWAELVAQVAATDTEIQRFRRFPLADIMRITGRPLLFEAFFNYTHFHVEDALSRQSEIKVLKADGSADTNFAFGAEFALDSSDGRLTLGLRYDSAQFTKEQIESFFGLYAAALTDMAARPHEPYHSAELLSGEQRRQLAEWNATGRDYAGPFLLHRLVEAQVVRTPDAVALRCAGEELSYREMDVRATNLARVLHEHSIGRGDFVAVVLDRSVDLPVTLLGVLKAGAAYVPLDPGDPDLRLRSILTDGAIHSVITTHQWAQRFNLPDVRVIETGGALDAAHGQDLVWSCDDVTPDDPAYMIYTSGSTGKPKGVVVSHRAISNRLFWHQETFGLTAGEAVLQKTPYTFDVSVWELFWPLMTGGVEVLAQPGGHRDPAYLARLIQEERITTVHFVPSMLQVFLEDQASALCRGLMRVLCSGEALPSELQERFFQILDGVELHNLYGPTEAAVDVTYWQCAVDGRPNVPIGRPIANTGAHILDSYGQPVPVGVTGELHLSGIQLAVGYHNRPDLTDTAFVHRTDEDGHERRMYRTGDLARWLPDGILEYRGRQDSQIKLRGFRIELQEIEAVLATHPAVHECAVRVDGQHLVAYTTAPTHTVTATPRQLSDYIAAHLTAYMVPTVWVPVTTMPLTSSGKLNRSALPAATLTTTETGGPTPPSNPAEERLLGIWQRLLGADRLGVHDDFYRVGGHSLAAVRLVAHINADFGSDLGVSTVLTHPTVALQAELLAHAAADGPSGAPAARAVHIGGTGPRPPLFLVHAAGGGVLCYRTFATAPFNRPRYALGAPGLAAGECPLMSVEELAAYHLEAVRAVQASGPYRLAGWSFGGVVAFEMARRLCAEGETVELLGMIDSAYPDHSSAPASLPDALAAFAEDTLFSAGLQVDDALRRELGAIGDAQDGLRAIGSRLSKQPGADVGQDQLARQYAVFRHNLEAMTAYRPAPFAGHVHFFEGTDGAHNRASERWRGMVEGEFTAHAVAADHYAMVRQPHVTAIADGLEHGKAS